jgi:hypothetical protein
MKTGLLWTRSFDDAPERATEGGLLHDPQNRTGPFPSIRLKQALAGRMAWRRTMRSFGSVSSAGPFTATYVAASNLSVGSGVIVIFAVWAHLTASARFRAGHQGPVSGRLSTTRQLEDWHRRHGFPLPFGGPAFASRSSCSRRGVGPSSRSAYRARPGVPGPRRGFPVPHTRAATGEGALYTPGTTVLTPTEATTGQAPATSQRPVPAPCRTSHRQGSHNEALRGFTQFARPVFPRLWPPGWNGPPLGFPPGFAPRRPGAGRRTPRWGQAIEHGPGTTRSTHQSISNPVVHSLCATSGRTSPRRWSAVRRPSGVKRSRRAGRQQSARWHGCMAEVVRQQSPSAGLSASAGWLHGWSTGGPAEGRLTRTSTGKDRRRLCRGRSRRVSAD